MGTKSDDKPMNNQWISMIWVLYSHSWKFSKVNFSTSQRSLAVTVLVNRGLKSSTTLRILYFWAWFPFSKLPISTLGSKYGILCRNGKYQTLFQENVKFSNLKNMLIPMIPQFLKFYFFLFDFRYFLLRSINKSKKVVVKGQFFIL